MEAPTCKCGHKDYDHYPKGKKCQALKDDGTFCKCSTFRIKRKEVIAH